jgi:hypothetical protein
MPSPWRSSVALMPCADLPERIVTIAPLRPHGLSHGTSCGHNSSGCGGARSSGLKGPQRSNRVRRTPMTRRNVATPRFLARASCGPRRRRTLVSVRARVDTNVRRGSRMRRRDFIARAWRGGRTAHVRAQQGEQSRRVGVLTTNDDNDSEAKAFGLEVPIPIAVCADQMIE